MDDMQLMYTKFGLVDSIFGLMERSNQRLRLTSSPWEGLPDVSQYHDCFGVVGSHLKRVTAAELEEMNATYRQAGVRCLKYENFKKTAYDLSKLDLQPMDSREPRNIDNARAICSPIFSRLQLDNWNSKGSLLDR